jgi:lysine biosynthesis protein LysW
MVEITCPECGAKSKFQKEELTSFGRVECEGCGVVLEVVEEDPLRVEVVEGYVPSDDDDYDDEDDDI